MQKALFGKENIRVVCHEHGKTPWVFCPEISSAICAYQSDLPKNGHESLKLVSKMAFKKWNINIRLEHSAMRNSTTFLEIPQFLEIFHFLPKRSTRKIVFFFLSNRIFWKRYRK